MSSQGLEVRGLTKSFTDEIVLREIDLRVQSGEYCVVLGPSGCGKSTLLRCIAGINTPDDGVVELHGTDISDSPVNDRNIGFVFQDFEDRLFPHLTVAENVAFGLELDDEGYTETEIDERVTEVLEFVSIGDLANDMPENLSGGQQQRVEIARQLVRETDTMLLDDPLGDLDYKLQKQLELDLRRRHAESEHTYVHVTHNQDEALKLADKLVVMNGGQIEQAGTTEFVYENPKTAFVCRFIGDSNLLTGEVTAVDSDQLVVNAEIGQVTVEDDGSLAEGDRVVLLVRPEHVALDTMADTFDNSYDGAVVGRTYTGQETQFAVELEGLDVAFKIHKYGDVTLDHEGGEVVVGFGADEVHLFGPDEISALDTVTVKDLKQL